jgi:hypothetical protein
MIILGLLLYVGVITAIAVLVTLGIARWSAWRNRPTVIHIRIVRVYVVYVHSLRPACNSHSKQLQA